jgi:hypothetical protein
MLLGNSSVALITLLSQQKNLFFILTGIVFPAAAPYFYIAKIFERIQFLEITFAHY